MAEDEIFESIKSRFNRQQGYSENFQINNISIPDELKPYLRFKSPSEPMVLDITPDGWEGLALQLAEAAAKWVGGKIVTDLFPPDKVDFQAIMNNAINRVTQIVL